MSGSSSETKRNMLIEHYREYVDAVVTRLMQSMSLPKNLRDEFIAAGYLGLVEAAERFDPARGAEFKSFAFLRIRGAVIDSVRKSCDVSERAYRFLRSLEAAQKLREEGLLKKEAGQGTPETPPKARLARALEYLSNSALAHRVVAIGQDHKVDAERTCHTTPEDDLQNKREADRLRRLIENLPEKERLIIKQYYFEGKKFIDIANDETGLSKSWISRLHNRAIDILRENYQKEDEAYASL